MARKPTYAQLAEKVSALEKEIIRCRRIEVQFLESEARLGSILDNTTAVIYVKDTDGRYLLINKQYEQLFHKTRDEMIGKTDHEVFPKEAADIFHANDRVCLKQNECVEFEERVPHDQGVNNYISLKFPLHNIDGDVYAVCGISTDITERKKAEELLKKAYAELEDRVQERTNALESANVKLKKEIEERLQAEKALRASERKFRKIFENLKDVYFETTLGGKIITASPSGAEFSGYSIEALIGSSVDMLYHNPGDREGLLKQLSANGKVREYEMLFKKKDGTTYDVSINADLFFDEQGNPKGMTGTIRDITLQKRYKEKVQRMKKMESLGLMAGGIAHDLNNILSGIVSYPDLILLELPQDSPLRRSIQVIKDSGQRAADVVSDLLTMAKGIATGKDVSNLNTIVDEFLGSAEFKTIIRDYPFVVLEKQLSPDLLNVRCSSPHMKKILMNLVLNAAEAIAAEGKIIIRTTNHYLEKQLRGYDDIQSGEYVLLSVSDTGSGIPSDAINRIFEPFYTKKVMGRSGTGLGLAVVWNAVADHDGYIDVRSNNPGAVFDLYFPADREAVALPHEAIDIKDVMGNGERILVVDDEPAQLDIACSLLTRAGYHVDAVDSGEKAVDYLETQSPDLVILDMIMAPGINGRQTYERMIKIQPGIKAILVSGYAQSEDVRRAQQSGAGQFVKKPYTLRNIAVSLKSELSC